MSIYYRPFGKFMREKAIASEGLNVDVFRKLKVFEGLPASELQTLATRMKQLRVKRSRTIIVEGLPSNDLYVLLSGEGRVQNTRVLESAGDSLDRATIEAVQQWEYTPANCGKAPLPAETEVQVNFALSF